MLSICFLLKFCLSTTSFGDGFAFVIDVGFVLAKSPKEITHCSNKEDITSSNVVATVESSTSVKFVAERVAFLQLSVKSGATVTLKGPIICDLTCDSATIIILIQNNIVPIISSVFQESDSTVIFANGGGNDWNIRAAGLYQNDRSFSPTIIKLLVGFTPTQSKNNIWLAGYETTDLSNIIEKIGFIKGFDVSYDFTLGPISFLALMIALLVTLLIIISIWICCCCCGGCCCCKGSCCCCACCCHRRDRSSTNDVLRDRIVV